MRLFPTRHRFSQWDGTQDLGVAADDVLGAMVDDLMEYGDLRWAMRNLMSRGMDIPQGGHKQGLREMLRNLRDRKRENLDQFNLSGIFKDIEKKLDEILDMERGSIDELLEGKDDDFSNQVLQQIAENNKEKLDSLPDNPAGKMQQLEKYEFLNPDAQKKYIELLNQLREAMTQTFFKDIERMVNNMSPGDIERMKDMLKSLNDLMSKKSKGVDPDVLQSHFDKFMDQFGDMFGDNPPKNLDELMEQMRQQMAAAQSLFNSLNPDQRQQLQSLLSDRFGDPELESELQRLAQAMSSFNPRGSRYRFGGREDIDLEAAMRLMAEMRQLDELISQVQAAERGGDLERIDEDLLKELLGDEASDSLDDLKKLLKALDEAGYIRPNGDKWELTPRGSRMIGLKALGEIYARLRRQSLGNHALPEEGRFGERLEQTKAYEFGDPFHLHMPRTIRNAIDRDGPKTTGELAPRRLRDLPLGTHHLDGNRHARGPVLVDGASGFVPSGEEGRAGPAQPDHLAVPEGLVLHHRLRSLRQGTQGARPAFPAVGRIRPRHQHAARPATRRTHAGKALGRVQADHHDLGRRAHAHLENGRARFAYPPTAETYRATFRAVKHCTQKSIADQYLHARRGLPPEGLHGRHRPHQWRSRLLHLAGETRRVHPGRLRPEQADENRPLGMRELQLRVQHRQSRW